MHKPTAPGAESRCSVLLENSDFYLDVHRSPDGRLCKIEDATLNINLKALFTRAILAT
jgi:hypothetical protein